MLIRTLLAALLLTGSLLSQAASPVPKAALVSAHPSATVAGLETLAQGGNAFDAAVAMAAALAVAEPYGSGLGGGGFFLLRLAGGEPQYRFIDARERAPLAASADMYVRDGKVDSKLSLDGPLAAAIPGLPAALVHLTERYGQLPLADNLTPAIRLARSGFSVDPIYTERAQWRLSALREDPTSAKIFLADGEPPEDFALIRQPDLARTLERLAQRGHAGFYQGQTAELLVNGVRRAGGIWQLKDLLDYQVVERTPLEVKLNNGRTLITAPPPSAGGIILAQSLRMLEQLPWQTSDKALRSHYVVETLRRAYHDRGQLGDPDFIHNPTQQLLETSYLQRQAAHINPQQATSSLSLGQQVTPKEGDNTTHFSVIDQHGNAVSATLSINLPFGAAFTVPETGVLLNNEMDDFAADPSGSNTYGLTGSKANAIAAGKRPLSSMSPSFIESEAQLASFGTPGGSRIPSMVLLAMLEYLDGQAVDQWPSVARYHHQFLPDHIEHEDNAFSPAEKAELAARGHQLKELSRRYGNQQVLLWDKHSGQLKAASDPRGRGLAYPLPTRPD